MKLLLILISLLLCGPSAHGKTKSPIKVKELSASYKKYQKKSRSSYAKNPNYQSDVYLAFNVGKHLYSNHELSGIIDGSQYRNLQWRNRNGLKLTSWLSFEHEHLSSHQLDQYAKNYPNTDSFGFRVHLIK